MRSRSGKRDLGKAAFCFEKHGESQWEIRPASRSAYHAPFCIPFTLYSKNGSEIGAADIGIGPHGIIRINLWFDEGIFRYENSRRSADVDRYRRRGLSGSSALWYKIEREQH